MANNITNILDIKGPKGIIATLVSKIYRVEKAEENTGEYKIGDPIPIVDFKGTVPMPKELENTTSPPQDDAERRMQEELAKKYGAGNWYDWCRKNWGTKWNAYNACESETIRSGVRFRFDTAWGPPGNWLIATARAFPSLELTDAWIDEGGGAGRLWLKDCTMTDVEISDHDWRMEFDADYKRQYELITKGDYQKVLDTYSDLSNELYYYELQKALLKRIKDIDLSLFMKFEWYDDLKEQFDERLKGVTPKRKIRWKE